MGKFQAVPLRERFWKHVTKPVDVGCWLWNGSKDKDGYGYTTTDITSDRPKKTIKAHRASWVLAFGQIPKGLWVLHKCDTPSCVRPDHLFLGTASDNVRDAVKKGRWKQGQLKQMAKLTQDQVVEIRRRYAFRGKDNTSSLAKEFGVNHVSIWRAVHNVCWKDALAGDAYVPEPYEPEAPEFPGQED